MDSDSRITKRLHISGLTPALTPADLSARLSHFGTVKSLDGFGLPDGVGQPRKFGYVTLETTSSALKKCFSTLSGTTYKGAKLRIGEAKPDYAERISKERGDPEPPAKRPRLQYSKFTGVEAEDMSLVTKEEAAQRPGWKLMPSGRVVRTMRMRPGKPLPPLPAKTSDDGARKKKRRVKDPDVRARSRTIDVTKWNGSYITGVFLGGDEVAKITDENRRSPPASAKKAKKEKKKSELARTEDISATETLLKPQKVPAMQPDPSSHPFAPAPAPSASIPAADPADLSKERAETLSFLNSFLFSSASKTDPTAPMDWGSDVELDETNVVEARNIQGTNEEYEVVPRDRRDEEEEDRMNVDVDDRSEDGDGEQDGEEHSARDESSVTGETTTTAAVPQPIPKPSTPRNSLKDLFAPREDDGGFSLLNHLDLDLDDELDLDMVPFLTTASATTVTQVPQSIPVPIPITKPLPPTSSTTSASRAHQIITLDPKKPLFFPTSKGSVLSSSTTGTTAAASSPFYQRQTEDEIQKRWEENKLELTRGWKKRYREAGKVRRRRGGGVED